MFKHLNLNNLFKVKSTNANNLTSPWPFWIKTRLKADLLTPTEIVTDKERGETLTLI